jgi:hypothetical protein
MKCAFHNKNFTVYCPDCQDMDEPCVEEICAKRGCQILQDQPRYRICGKVFCSACHEECLPMPEESTREAEPQGDEWKSIA